MEKGEITAFLSLIFVLMISFVTAILESASVQAEKNQARLDMDRAVYSVFGEYQKELLEEYGIFAVEGSYETGNFSEKQLIDRMHYYGASGIWPEVEGIQFLTDQNGQAFREGAVKYMEDLYGISIIQGLGALAEKWEQQEITGEQTKDESNQSLEELDDMLNQNQSSLPMENNPLPHIEQLKKSGLISLVFPKEKQVSQKQIRGEEQASSRALRVGRGTFSVRSDVDEVTKKLLFHEYILKKFGHAVEEEKEKRSLAYEVEYLLEGKTSDQENLEAVLNKMLLIRMGLNFVYLQTDTAKQAEAGAMALALATAVALPMLEPVVKQVLLAAWAFGESVMDLRSLMSGKRVALVKTAENWQLSLSSLMKMGTSEDTQEGADVTDGWDYKSYLRMLLFLENGDHLTMRTLDRVEQNLIYEKGLAFFRADACVTKLRLQNLVQIRNGLSYEFPLYFGYE